MLPDDSLCSPDAATIDKTVDGGTCVTEAASAAWVDTAIVASTAGDGGCTSDVAVRPASRNAADDPGTIAKVGRDSIERDQPQHLIARGDDSYTGWGDVEQPPDRKPYRLSIA